MSGILSTTLRQPEPDREPAPDAETVVLDSAGAQSGPNIVVDFPDGSVSINVNPSGLAGQPLKNSKFYDNLAEFLPDAYLGTLAEDLLQGID